MYFNKLNDGGTYSQNITMNTDSNGFRQERQPKTLIPYDRIEFTQSLFRFVGLGTDHVVFFNTN